MNMMPRDPILLIEDNPDDRLLTRRALLRNGIANPLVEAEDGDAAMRLLFGPERLRPALILLDLKLPKVSGYDVLKAIRADGQLRCVPVVVLTASSDNADMVAGYELSANSFIRKPVEFEEFHRIVGQVGLYWLLINASPSLSAPTSHNDTAPRAAS